MTQEQIEQAAAQHIRSEYAKKHPIILHLRMNQGFHFDEVVALMASFPAAQFKGSREMAESLRGVIAEADRKTLAFERARALLAEYDSQTKKP